MSFRIDYIGASWCKVCTVVWPAVETLSKSFGVPVTVLDVDAIEDDTVLKVPTLRVFKDEILFAQIVTKHVEALKEILQKEKPLEISQDF
jgi:thiol-disulfide isomerase/thioredoxin